jgi:hypothetical protein
VPQRDREEPDPRGPPLGPVEGRAQAGVVEAREQRPRLARGEGELRGPDLGQPAPDPQQVERQAGIGPRGDDEPQLLRRPVQQARDGLDEAAGRGMEVLEHEHRRPVELGEPVEQAVEERRRRVAPRRVERRERRSGRRRVRERGGELRPERRLAAVRTQREPREARRPAGRCPRREQHRLAGARVRADEGEHAVADAAVERVEEPRPFDERRGQARHHQVRGDDHLRVADRTTASAPRWRQGRHGSFRGVVKGISGRGADSRGIGGGVIRPG